MFCHTRSSSYKSRSAATLVGSSTLGLFGQRKSGLQDRETVVKLRASNGALNIVNNQTTKTLYCTYPQPSIVEG